MAVVDFWRQDVAPGRVKEILDGCACERGCYPLVNRTLEEFGSFILDSLTDEELLKYAELFSEHCSEKYRKIREEYYSNNDV